MDLAEFRSLLTPAGQEALQVAGLLQPREVDFLAHHQALSRRFPPGLVRAALEVAILRGEAAAKFSHADQMYFTRTALEQASAHPVSAYRAARYRRLDFLADLGCSVGGDTLALAALAPTLALDLDPLRLAMAQANLDALGLAGRVQCLQADLTQPLPFCPAQSTGLFFDPARRAAARRIFHVRDYLPPLAVVRTWLPRFPALGVKISPGVNLDELAGYEAEIEFISLHGELKEAALWFGALRSAERRATLLPGPHTLTASPTAVSRLAPAPLAYLYEPDPAVLRAGLVTTLAEQIDAAQLDPDIAYLTSNSLTPTPFARSWAVEDWLPFQLKRLRAYLRQRDIGQVTVKKRGSPLEPQALIRDLRLSGPEQCVLVLTHLNGQPIVLVCQQVS